MGGISGRFARSGWFWGAPPGLVTVVVSMWMMAEAQRRIEEAFDALAGAYADDLEYLERSFGTHLRTHYPQVVSAHARRRLEFHDGLDCRLVLDLAEPTRTRLGWGGAHLQGWRQSEAIALPAPDLFLTFARGLHPEWVARWPGVLRRRLAVVNDAFIAQTVQQVFGPSGGPTVR